MRLQSHLKIGKKFLADGCPTVGNRWLAALPKLCRAWQGMAEEAWAPGDLERECEVFSAQVQGQRHVRSFQSRIWAAVLP